MSYDPTEWAPQAPGQPPAQPPVTPPMYGQAPQPPVPPASEQVAPTQYAGQPPAYGQPQQPPVPSAPAYGQPQPPVPSAPAYGQSNPNLPPYGQPAQPGQSNPGLPPYGQPQPAAPAYGQSNPNLPSYGTAPANPYAPTPSNPNLPPYGQPGQSNPGLPPYGQPQQFGQSSPTLPPYGQPAQPGQSNPGLPPYSAPAEQYAQPQQPWGAPVPPAYMPPAAPPKKSGAKPWVIVLVVVLILALVGGGGFAYYQSTRPKPAISVTSTYTDGTTQVGAASTSFTLKGSDFTANSAITILLDGHPAPGAPNVQSDSKGNLPSTQLAVTSAWSVGTHTLTAQDASNYLTKTGIKVEIVTPGQAKTPGPNGAPTDSANMSVEALVVAGSSSGKANLTVTGSPSGGKVCGDMDDGKPHTHTGEVNGVAYSEVVIDTCSGTYKGGKLDYTETSTSDKLTFTNGLICTANVPYVAAHLVGTFTSATAVNGTYSEDAITVNCNLGVGSSNTTANSGTWTGIATVQ